jgi:chromosome segregation ATPase
VSAYQGPYRGLEFDPAPGSVDAVHAAITQLTTADSALGSVEPALRDAERHSAGWQGDAAETFRGRLRDTPSDFDATQRRLRDAVSVLERWSETLAVNQRHAGSLDAEAVRIRRGLSDARDAVQDKQNALDLAATPSAATGASIELSAAANRAAELEARLDEVLGKARALAQEHQRAADQAADELAATGSADLAPRAVTRSPIHALAGVLSDASRTAATLGGLLRPPGSAVHPVAAGAPGSFAAALAGGLRPTGEAIVLGETPLRADS